VKALYSDRIAELCEKWDINRETLAVCRK